MIVSCIAKSLWLAARVLKKQILTNFVTPFIAFMEKKISEDPQSTIFTEKTPFIFIHEGYFHWI